MSSNQVIDCEDQVGSKQLCTAITDMLNWQNQVNNVSNNNSNQSGDGDALTENAQQEPAECDIPTENGLVLKREDVKMIHAQKTIWLSDNCDFAPENRLCIPHLSIQTGNSKLKTEMGHELWEATDIHKGTLLGLITKSGTTWDHKLGMMKELALAIQHLHRSGSPHGNLNESCISISIDGTGRPFIWRAEETLQHDALDTKNRGKSDIENLGKIFYSILTQGESHSRSVEDMRKINHYLLKHATDILLPQFTHQRAPLSEDDVHALQKVLSQEPAETAKDLIEKMVTRKIDIHQVLEHPLFWTPEEKIVFVAQLFDSMGRNSEIINKLELKSRQSVFEKNWTESLRLTPADRTVMTGGLIEKRIKKNVNKDLLYNKACGSSKEIKISQFIISGNCLEEVKVLNADKKTWNKLKQQVDGDEKNTSGDHKTSGIPDVIKQKNQWIFDKVNCIVSATMIFRREDKEHAGYDGTSFCELMRFIRNRKAHCWEGKPDEKQYYEALGGFWNFYSKRFPKLITVLYEGKSKFPCYDESSHSSNA